jgi:hypothetical protein
MAYLFRQKFKVDDLANLTAEKIPVLIFSADSFLAQIYAAYLRAHNLEVKHCQDELMLKDSLLRFAPRLLLADANFFSSIGGNWLGPINIKRDFPSLLVVTVGRGLGAESLAKLMRAGVSSHVDRRFSRPQDLAVVVKTLLQN